MKKNKKNMERFISNAKKNYPDKKKTVNICSGD
jgi:hypothetical protein